MTAVVSKGLASAAAEGLSITPARETGMEVVGLPVGIVEPAADVIAIEGEETEEANVELAAKDARAVDDALPASSEVADATELETAGSADALEEPNVNV